MYNERNISTCKTRVHRVKKLEGTQTVQTSFELDLCQG